MNCRGSQASRPRLSAEVLEACMVGGMMSHELPRLAGFPTQISLQRCSRHAWLEACCPMGCPGSQFSRPRLLCRGARGMHGWRHDVSWVVEVRKPLDPDFCADLLEACMVGGMLLHGWSRSAGFSTRIVVQRRPRHSWLEA